MKWFAYYPKLRLIQDGVQLVVLSWYGDIIWLLIQLTISDEELDKVFKVIDKAVIAVEKQFL